MTSSLPHAGLFVTGTDTDVGKTWISVQLLKTLRQQGYQITARKPVASGASLHGRQLLATDTLQLAQASDTHVEQVTTFTFAPPISPARAARLVGTDTSLPRLKTACSAPSDVWTLVEGAGGFCSPLGSDGSLNRDLAEALALPVLLVVGNRLGCINHTLLTLMAIEQTRLPLAGIVLNDVQPQADPETAEELRQLIPKGCPLFHAAYHAELTTQPDWHHWVRQHLMKCFRKVET